MAYKILIVEDEKNIRRYLTLSLKNAGYNTIEAASGEEGYRLSQWERPDAILLDIGLPGIDGVKVCQLIREKDQSVGIILLTAKSLLEDKEEGFQAGADDYCVKPCDIKEIQMRIEAVLRRSKGRETAVVQTLISGAYHLDLVCHEFKLSNQLLNLSPTEFALVHLFMESPGKVFLRDELLDRIWGLHYSGDPKVVDVFIRRIRSKIEQISGENPIETVWGKGYKWQG